jgi:hypothetical protein
VNINLGKEFEGGDLYFSSRLNEAVEHKVGNAVIHSGEITHGAFALRNGERINLVLWFKIETLPFEIFQNFPTDVVTHVLSQLNPADLCAISQCSKKMYQLANSQILWKNLSFKYHPSVMEQIQAYEKAIEKPSEVFSDWKQVYKMCHLENVIASSYLEANLSLSSHSAPKILHKQVLFPEAVSSTCFYVVGSNPESSKNANYRIKEIFERPF